MLRDVDVLLFDIQDVGARFYTYASTMAYVIEAAAENGKTIIILDRPNPVNGVDVEGPVLDTAFSSFVGLFPIPIRHGMTLGELAKMIVGEKWLVGQTATAVDITVIPMEGWKRQMWYDETGVPWISPSPNMRTLETATVYPGMCLFEGTNVTEGRGTPKPFEFIGAPWIDGDSLAVGLNKRNPPGVRFEAIHFSPTPDPVAAPSPKYRNDSCGGVYVHLINRSTFKPVWTALMMIREIRARYDGKFQFQAGTFDRLAGNSSIRSALEANESRVSEPISGTNGEAEQRFERIRKKYLLY
jgi:uncharacterized protein YbbC (DUF1343 family)